MVLVSINQGLFMQSFVISIAKNSNKKKKINFFCVCCSAEFESNFVENAAAATHFTRPLYVWKPRWWHVLYYFYPLGHILQYHRLALDIFTWKYYCSLKCAPPLSYPCHFTILTLLSLLTHKILSLLFIHNL